MKTRFFSLTALSLACLTETQAKFEGAWPAIPEEEARKIEEAIPSTASVEPRDARKLLIFSKGIEANHKATPHGMKALELMGQMTGAFEVTHTYDPEMLKADNLAPFDALVFNNSNRLDYLNDPEIQEGILGFVRGGKGFVGIHAATTNFTPRWNSDWPEGAEMICGVFDGHPWHSQVTLKVEEPAHSINDGFEEPTFEIHDEIYQFTGPYSRDKVRVLLSLDLLNTDTPHHRRRNIERKDLDFPVSWVRSFGEGRVFYCSLGHDPHVFWDPRVLQHYLDGIQYALGDLEAESIPSTIRDQISLKGTGFGNVEQLLSSFSNYTGGETTGLVKNLEELVKSLPESAKIQKAVEQRFITFLESDATIEAKQLVCERLETFASEVSISQLSEMLYDPTTSEMARNTLSSIPGDAATFALSVALYKLEGEDLVGVIEAIGVRGDSASIPRLEELTKSEDEAVREAASSAVTSVTK